MIKGLPNRQERRKRLEAWMWMRDFAKVQKKVLWNTILKDNLSPDSRKALLMVMKAINHALRHAKRTTLVDGIYLEAIPTHLEKALDANYIEALKSLDIYVEANPDSPGTARIRLKYLF